MEHRLLILRENELNWFELVAELGILLQNYSEDTLAYELTEFSDHLLSNMDLTEEEQRMAELSTQVYLEHERYRAIHDDSRLATDSDSDNPDDWLSSANVVTDDSTKGCLKSSDQISEYGKGH